MPSGSPFRRRFPAHGPYFPFPHPLRHRNGQTADLLRPLQKRRGWMRAPVPIPASWMPFLRLCFLALCGSSQRGFPASSSSCPFDGGGIRKSPPLLHAVQLRLPQPAFHLPGKPGEARDLRPGGGDIVADLVVSLPGPSAAKTDSPPDPPGIIKNRGSPVQFSLLENVKIVVGAAAETTGTGQGRKDGLSKQLFCSI